MKGLILFAQAMEDGEALTTRALLKRAGLSVDSFVVSGDKSVTTAYKLAVTADYRLSEINPLEYDFLVIPGGPYVGQTIDADHKIKALAKSMVDAGKIVAAICAGPRFLGQAGLLDDKQFTCYPGGERDMPLGQYLADQKVVKDGRIITARAAGSVVEFSAMITETLLGANAKKQLLESIHY